MSNCDLAGSHSSAVMALNYPWYITITTMTIGNRHRATYSDSQSRSLGSTSRS